MPDIPGLPLDVYFGDTETELPDWRAAASEHASEDDEDRPLTGDERQSLISILGFDPRDLAEESGV